MKTRRSQTTRCGSAKTSLILIALLAGLAGLAGWAGPKVYRRLSGNPEHHVWMVMRHQEVERYGEALAIFDELRLELPPSEVGIGRLLANLPLTLARSLDDQEPTDLKQLAAQGPLVLTHRDPGDSNQELCAGDLSLMQERFAPLGVRFVAFYTGSGIDASAARLDSDKLGQDVSFVLDPEGLLARELGLRAANDVFLVDRARTLVYRGAIDDTRLEEDGSRADGRRKFLSDALQLTLASRPVPHSATRALGAPVHFGEPGGPRGVEQITWTNRVQRIVQTNCQRCHNTEGAAPFSLETYGDVRGRRRMIKVVLEERAMPPWMAQEGTGPWRNSLEITPDDRDDLMAWIEDGAPEGDPEDAAVSLDWPAWDEWVIGEPDYIVEADKPVHIPADGIIPIQNFPVSVTFPEDRWIQAIQLLPSTQGVLHHATIFIQPPNGRKLFLDALLPGKAPTVYPAGQARFIPKGTTFRFIIHYTVNGVETEDLLRLGLRYADAPPIREVHSIWMTNNEFVVPAYDPNYEVTAEFTLPREVLMKQFMPHMHLRGKTFTAVAIKPDGEVIQLLHQPTWNLDWQYAYELFEPVYLPAGTLIRCTGVYDNSADNPNNPDPSVDVPFGQQTFLEMLGFGMDFIDP